MKRQLILAVALVATLLLGGCTSTTTPEGYTLEDAQVLLDSGVFDGDMAQVDSTVIPALYGLDAQLVEACVSYQATNTAQSADELTILVMKDEEGARQAETACESRLDKQLTTSRSYCPQAVPRLESAVIRRVGNTVLLAVGDPDHLAATIDQLAKQ